MKFQQRNPNNLHCTIFSRAIGEQQGFVLGSESMVS
jgi:hypothetical protein